MKIRKTIAQLSTYKPPLEGRNPKEFILMDFNESPLALPPHVVDRLMAYLQQNHLHIYPSYGDFLNLLGRYVNVSPDSLILCNGSDQAIDIILRCVLEDGDEMVLAKPGFSMFFQIAGTLGAKMVSPFYNEDMSFPFEAIQSAVSSQTRLLVIINPNNPTGTSASLEQIEYFLKTYPELPVLVDEAYFEFTQKSCVSLLPQYSNLIITRTFSKAFAMPSLRLGYAIGAPEFIQHLYKIRGPYDVNMMALIAATAQLENPEPWKAVVDEVMLKAKPELEQFFKAYGVTYFPGNAHYMLVVPKGDIQTAITFLKQKGILVRPMAPPIAHTFRMNVGTVSSTRQFIQIYKSFLTA
ncbi:histidinol-phosphate transaminase [Deltaproteobacteria bacterium TL4]